MSVMFSAPKKSYWLIPNKNSSTAIHYRLFHGVAKPTQQLVSNFLDCKITFFSFKIF